MLDLLGIIITLYACLGIMAWHVLSMKWGMWKAQLTERARDEGYREGWTDAMDEFAEANVYLPAPFNVDLVEAS